MTSAKLSDEVQMVFEPFLFSYLEPTLTILQKDKSLSPMGMILENSGQARFVGLVPEDENNYDIAAHLNAYRRLLEQELKGNKASLLGYDVKIHDPEYKDAICVELYHQDGVHLTVLVPYKFTGFRKKLSTGEMQRVG